MKIRILIWILFISLFFKDNISAQTTEEKMKDACLSIVINEKKVAPQTAVAIKISVPMNEIGTKMGELYGKIMGFLGQNGIAPSSAPFAVYYSFDPEGEVVLEAAVPVSEEIETSGDIIYKEYPEMKVLSAMHVGPYDKIEPVYNEMQKYADKNKIELINIAWEVYLTDPNIETNPDNYKTLVYLQVKE